ncbi:MAG: acetolactate synthase small subunit [Verrucomicrobiota bacterium JB022]|nr:acetolactate synthase small subunit [Verrucomicrobiota bacterium JB022]
MRHTLSVLVENKFGVLARVAGMFSGRGFNIDTLNVAPTHDPKYSRITATVMGDTQQLDQAIKQLNKLIDVIEVQDLAQGAFVARELVLVKVVAEAGDKRAEIVQICDIFRAKIVDVSHRSVIVEMTGNQEKIEAFLHMIEPFGVRSMARTGMAALGRNRQLELQ